MKKQSSMPRSFHHDYTTRCIYHITMVKAPAAPYFGRLAGRLPDIAVERSALGRIIERNIRNIPALNPKLRILQYVIMPDHIHFLLFATEKLEMPVGKYMGMFKVRIFQEFNMISGSRESVFTPDFDDRILYRSRSLDTIFRYIRENPYRLAARRDRPDFFRRVNRLEIAGGEWQGYGNFQLLENPFKEQVVAHRADTPERRGQNRAL